MSFNDLVNTALDVCIDTFQDETFTKYKTKNGNEYSLKGIVETGFIEEDPNTKFQIGSSKTIISIKTKDFLLLGFTPARGDLLLISGKDYRVDDIEADGYQITKLILDIKKA
jgi:Mg2+/Co2+ transporter CorC